MNTKLMEYRVDGAVDKVEVSIKRLIQFEPEEGYYLCFSGGKDSVVLKHLCKLAGVKYDGHYNITSVDPPELVRFIKEEHTDIQRERFYYEDGRPITMWNLIPKKLMPPTRRNAYCCDQLKERGGAGRIAITGVRWAEGRRRAMNQGVLTMYNSVGKLQKEAENYGFRLNKAGGGLHYSMITKMHAAWLRTAIKSTRPSLIPLLIGQMKTFGILYAANIFRTAVYMTVERAG